MKNKNSLLKTLIRTVLFMENEAFDNQKKKEESKKELHKTPSQAINAKLIDRLETRVFELKEELEEVKKLNERLINATCSFLKELDKIN